MPLPHGMAGRSPLQPSWNGLSVRISAQPYSEMLPAERSGSVPLVPALDGHIGTPGGSEAGSYDGYEDEDLDNDGGGGGYRDTDGDPPPAQAPEERAQRAHWALVCR